MKLEQLPLVGSVLETGAEDRVYDGLLLAGPLVVGLIALLGRSPITVALAAGYLVAFVGHTALNRR